MNVTITCYECLGGTRQTLLTTGGHTYLYAWNPGEEMNVFAALGRHVDREWLTMDEAKATARAIAQTFFEEI